MRPNTTQSKALSRYQLNACLQASEKLVFPKRFLMKIFFTFCFVFIGFTAAFAQNEQAPILEKDIAYKDWTLKGIRDGKDTNLRDLTKNKKLVAVVYFAPWCHNWQHDAPMLARLYDKYKTNGFEIVAVGEYGSVDAMNESLASFKITFPAVYESVSQSDLSTTPHYAYRQSTGDKRKWGSPYYIFIDPSRIEKRGDVLLTKTDVINGELIETEGEQYIRQKLGLPAEPKLTSTSKTAVEVCDPDKPLPLKKH
jgi:thiol-disulfide isomerase/thioredoxin